MLIQHPDKAKMKQALTLISIGVFLMIALASLGPDGSTNTKVSIKDCMEKPAVQGKLRVDVTVLDTLGQPLGTGRMHIYIVHQKVKPDTSCTFDVIFGATHTVNVPSNGHYVYEGNDYIHDNSEDLFRVEVSFTADGAPGHAFTLIREVQVKKYSNSDFQFTFKVKPPL